MLLVVSSVSKYPFACVCYTMRVCMQVRMDCNCAVVDRDVQMGLQWVHPVIRSVQQQQLLTSRCQAVVPVTSLAHRRHSEFTLHLFLSINIFFYMPVICYDI